MSYSDMRSASFLLLMALVLHIPAVASAEPLYDIAYAYDMRQTTPERDGDVTYFMMGRSDSDGRIMTRFDIALGIRNEYWSGTYPPAGTFGIGVSVLEERFRYGLGGKMRIADGDWTSMDLGYAAEWQHDRSEVRTFSGLQFLSSDDYFETGSVGSAFWLMEGSFWLTPNMALRGSMGSDDGSHIVSVSTALGRRGWPIAIEADLTVGLPEYRQNSEHSDLFVGLRWLGPDRLRNESLRERERTRGIRLFYRPTEPG